MKLAFIVLVAAMIGGSIVTARDSSPPTKAPLLELRDQFDNSQRITFPRTNLVVLTIADHKGSEEIDGWVRALKTRYHGAIDIHGIADVRRVPSILRTRVQRKFQDKQKYPVMMDWSGATCSLFGSKPGVANIVIVAADGAILSSQNGRATENALNAAFHTIDAALLSDANSVTNNSAKIVIPLKRQTNVN